MPIRPATVEDIGDIRKIAERTWVEAYAHIMGEKNLQRRVLEEGFYSDQYLEKDITSEDSIFLLMEKEGETVGFCQVVYGERSSDRGESSPDQAEMRKLYIDPKHWRRGLGTSLFEKSVDVLPEYINSLKIFVLNRNERAKSFYRSKGFEKIDEEEISIWNESYLTDIMRKDL